MSRRFFQHGELPLAVLAIIAEQPRHGYDVMAELMRLFAPYYRASPGSVYPAIEALEVEGLIEAQTLASRSVYGVTDAGLEALQARAPMLASLGARTGVHLGIEDSLSGALTRFKARLDPLSGHVDPLAAGAILDQAAAAIESLTKSKRRSSSNAR